MGTHSPLDYLHHPRLNKGTAFTDAERDALKLRGLLPPKVTTPDAQLARIMETLRLKPTPLEQYIYLSSLHDRNEHLFYRAVMAHVEELMPIIYTPTVGEACREFGHIFRRPRGLYLSIEDAGRVRQLLGNWPEERVGIIVVTDGERILGLGDLGANGMGIPIGKLSLYTACAGIDPALCLPITLDVGTDRAELREDPLYLGLSRPRTRGAAYDALVEEFVTGVQEVFPGALIQFEDFATSQATSLLARYRDRVCCFNDDIQGTAAVTLAGLLSATRISGQSLREERVLFLGAGSAATGIADLIVAALVREGVAEPEARRHCWMVDRDGLVVAGEVAEGDHRRRYAHEHPPIRTLLAAIETLEPTVLVGVSAQPNAFDASVIGAMARLNPRPIIFPLSNPTSRAECTAEEAYRWSAGRAIVACGSPFPPVTLNGRVFRPGQGNNAYIFPGVGLGVIVSGARRVTDTMFYAAARTLAEMVSPAALEQGLLFPPLGEIREVSARIALAVAEVAWTEGLAGTPRPADLSAAIRGMMYDAEYPRYA